MSNISNLKNYSMCCGLYFHLLLKWLLALRLAYFCNAGTCWSTPVPRVGVINQGRDGKDTTGRQLVVHYSELPWGLRMPWYENLVVMVIAGSRSTALPPSSAWVINCGLGQRGPSFTRTQARAFLCRSQSPSHIQVCLFCPKCCVLSPEPAQTEKPMHRSEDQVKLPGGRDPAAVWPHWQLTLQIQIKEKNYKISNCQTPFLYDLELAARLFSLNMCEVTIRC